MQIRETFQQLYTATSKEDFEAKLKKWYFWATHSRLKPIIKAAKTIKRHWDGVDPNTLHYTLDIGIEVYVLLSLNEPAPFHHR